MDSKTVFTYENHFKDFIEHCSSMAHGREASPVPPVEIDGEMFFYWLEVLPPAFMRMTVEMIDGTKRRCSFGFADGYARIIGFWQEGERYFAQPTALIAPLAD